MSSSANFIGAGFFVAGARSPSPGVVRVEFNSAPNASNPAAADDALNPVNYVLSGPGPATVVSIAPVSGDPLSVDLTLSAPLAIGTWTVTVSNVETPANDILTAPTAAIFQITSTATVTPLSGGAENDDPEKIIRKHLSPALRGPNWDALIKALSVGDDRNWDNARLAFDQLFTSTASGSYLERRAADRGVTRPTNVGISDDLFRQLVIKTSTNKVVHEAIREILEIFYGQDSLRAFVESDLDENYNLSGEPDLRWTLDEKQEFVHVFRNSQFSSVTAAKAVEVAYALTKSMRDLGSKGFAVAFQSPETGKNRVRIYSGSLGLGSFARVTGGSAQNLFKFPAEIDTYSGTVGVGLGYNWVYTRPDQNTTRISLTINTGTTATLIDLADVHEDDYVIIGTPAQIGITGTFVIKGVRISWSGALLTQSFDIEQISFNSTAIQADNDAYRFYRPQKNGISAAGGRTVVVAQTRAGQVDISIPATTQAVNRGPRQAAYGRLADSVAITRLRRLPSGLVTVETDGAHGLVVDTQIQLDSIIPATSRPFVTPGNESTFPSSFTYPASLISISAETQEPPTPITENGTATLLTNGQILFAGGYLTAAGAYAGAQLGANRYQQGSTATIIDGTEADGATRHSHTWVATQSLNNARQYHAASAFGTGALVTGGLRLTPYTILNGVEEYLLGGVWINQAAMAEARSGHEQVQLDNGTVLVMGGATTEGTALRTTEIFNGTSWSAGATMNLPRTDFQAVKLSDGRVLAIGGRTMGRGHDLDSRTLGLWRMDESAGPTAADQTGTYPLTHTGVPIVSTAGKINNCLDFNTANSHLTGAGNAAAVTALLGEWTLEVWFKRTTNAAGQFVTYGGATEVLSDNVLLNAGVDSSGRVFWKWENGAGVDVTQTMTLALASLPAYRASFFNHLAVRKRFNGVNYDVSVFINGVNYQNWTGQANAAGGTTAAWFIARNPEIGGSGFQGFLDDVRVSKAARTDTEIIESFLHGWGNHQSPHGEIAIGELTPSCEIYDGGTWTMTGDMSLGRCFHRAVVLPGDYVLVTGGLGYVVTQLTTPVDTAITIWPSQSLAAAEVWDPNTGRWTKTQSTGIRRHGHVATYIASRNEVVVTAGKSTLLGGTSDDTSFVEIFDVERRSWKTAPSRLLDSRFPSTGAATADGTEIVITGGNDGLNTNLVAETFIAASQRVAAGGLNGQHRITAIPSPTSFQFETVSAPDELSYTSIFGANYQGFTFTTLEYNTKIAGWSVGETITGVTSLATAKVAAVVGGPPGAGTGKILLTNTVGTFQTAENLNGSVSGPAVAKVTRPQYQKGYSLGFWPTQSGSRSSNVTTLTLFFPQGLSTHDIGVGDSVYVNSRTGAFAAGLKTVTAVSDTTISYADPGANQASIAVIGSVSQLQAPDATAVAVSAGPQPINDPGPYVFDPLEGVAVTATESLTTTLALFANQQYEELEVADGSDFPDAGGYIVLGFGTENQSLAIKYLGKYQAAGGTRLILDYSYRFEKDYPIGSKVTLLSQKAAFAPDGSTLGSFYITASSAGRVAAQASAEAALAAGITPEITIVYPGDRGLGGEGLPTHGAQKLSDVVGVFAGDEITEEVEEAREN